ncbi:hypothetical protein O3M35_011703 [Rhynocoris fuscipes]|uniref:Uncharacterized protein n=1 Tax=Rhynocoris fuscipes TaxID=488301 RepID=A0AAW1CX78_9HEMI
MIYSFAIFIFLSFATLYSQACDYKLVVKNIKRCNDSGNENDILNPGMRFSDDCDLEPIGCVQLSKPTKKLEINYNIISAVTGITLEKKSMSACGLKIGSKTVKCPTQENEKICSEPGFSMPLAAKALLSVATAIGQIHGTFNIVTDAGTTCYEGDAWVEK